MSRKTIPNYLFVFEQRLDALRNKLQEQLDLPKEKREKKDLKLMLKEAKKLRNLIREIKNEHAMLCPHCGKKI
jgi:hypothetical protein